MIDYKKAEEILTSSSKFHIELGLERMYEILHLLGNPQNNLKIIHVAGTNGKGSTCAIIAQILKEAGYKTGLFTSPHLLKYNERFKINGKDINENEFAQEIFKINSLADKNNIPLTEFEILTAAAFDLFNSNKIDFLVLETGLGGRLDATNVIKNPLMCIITQIDFDHTERLGKTIEEIAFEKGGIIKKNSPVIINNTNKGIETIKKTASDKNAPLLIAESLENNQNEIETIFENNMNFALIKGKKIPFNLLGIWQKDNLALALKAAKTLNISFDAIKSALQNVHWACRFQYIREKNMILDGAHNPSGTKALRESLDKYFPNKNFCFVYGCLKNKDYESALKNLIKKGDKVYFCTFNHKSSETFENLSKTINYPCEKITINEIICIENDLSIVVCGSLYMLGELLFYNNL